ncbi:MAG: diacylglycerol/lipid kinase family protein [Armatimonadota bacterium]
MTELIHRERTAVLVVNARSRSGARYFYRIYDALQRHGVEVIAAYPVRDPARLLPVTRRAIRQDSHLVVVGGGDGTISAVADAFVGTDTVMGVIPLGTGNSSAHTLGIPHSIKRAVECILCGTVAEVDLGKIGDDYFMNVVSIGLTAESARRTPDKLKKILGKLAYLIAGSRVVLRHQPFQCRIRLDGRLISVQARQVIIANGRYFGETMLSPEASIQNGLLTIYTVEETGRWGLVWRLFRFLILRKPGLPGLPPLNATEVWIDTDPPQPVDIDGEAMATTPVHLTVAPRAVKVLLPATGSSNTF